MDVKGSRHIGRFDRIQNTDQMLGGRIFMMVTAVACIGLLVNASRLQARLWEHESEGMTMGVAGLADARDLWHVAADTTTKCVNPVGIAVLHRRVAALAQRVLKQTSLGDNSVQQIVGIPCGGERGLAFVDVVTGDADHTHLGMFALLPIQVLLVAVSGFPTGPEIFRILFGSGFIEIEPYVAFSLVDLVIKGIGVLPFLIAAPGVTGSTYLSGQGRG